MSMTVIFFGTHIFAATILQSLIDAPHIDVSLVVTRPDQPVGRKKILTPPRVKTLVLAHAIPVMQPEKLKDIVLPLSHVDIGITAQYGALIPPSLLTFPTHGMINVHTSLLPLYRGASPIQSAILHGDTHTGVSIMCMDKGLDTGPVLLQKTIPIDPDDTYLDLDTKLASLSAGTLLEALEPYIQGNLHPQPQNNDLATYCKELSRDDGHISWNTPNTHIYNAYRAYTPWPGIWTTFEGQRLKLLHVRPSKISGTPGQVVLDTNNTLHVCCLTGSLQINKVQKEGKSAMDSATFLQGHAHIVGSILV